MRIFVPLAMAAVMVALSGCGNADWWFATNAKLNKTRTDLEAEVKSLRTNTDGNSREMAKIKTDVTDQSLKIDGLVVEQESLVSDYVELGKLVRDHEVLLNNHDERITSLKKMVDDHSEIVTSTGLRALYDSSGKVLGETDLQEALKSYASVDLVQKVQDQMDAVSRVATGAATAAKAADDKAEAAKKEAEEARSKAESRVSPTALDSKLTQYASKAELKGYARSSALDERIHGVAKAAGRRFLPYPVQPEEPAMRVKDQDNVAISGKETNLGPTTFYRWWYNNPGWVLQARVYQWDAPPGAPRIQWVEVTRDGDFLVYPGFDWDGKRTTIRVQAPKISFPWPDDEAERRAKAAWERTRGGRVQVEYQ